MQHQTELTKLLNGSNVLFEFFKYMHITSLFILSTYFIPNESSKTKSSSFSKQDVKLVRKTKRA